MQHLPIRGFFAGDLIFEHCGDLIVHDTTKLAWVANVMKIHVVCLSFIQMARSEYAMIRSRENTSSNPCTLDNFVHSTLLQFTQLYEYMIIDNGGYLCTNCIRVLIAAWLNVSRLQHIQMVNKTSSFKIKLIGNNTEASTLSRNSHLMLKFPTF